MNRLTARSARTCRRLGLLLMGTMMTSSIATTSADTPSFAAADAAIEQAIADRKCPGAVLLVGRGDTIVYEKAYGSRALVPDVESMTADTVFDLASCTKPIAAATGVMILVDRGRIDLAAPVTRYLPEMASHGKEAITVQMLLTHTAGFVPDNPMGDYIGTREEMIQRIYDSKPNWTPGTHFAYSDVGFIVLGELVRRVDGRPLDQFAREEIFEPLRMDDAAFHPPATLRGRIAPTETRDGRPIRGEVHDPRAYALGGVAGHAGLFGTARDIAKWCRMLNAGGTLDGKRILGEATVKQMVSPHPLPKEAGPKEVGARGLGVDMSSSFAGCRGKRFDPATTFGHTGWTGTMFWSDPVNDVYFVLLTSRCHPDGKGDVKALRSTVATIVGETLLGPK